MKSFDDLLDKKCGYTICDKCILKEYDMLCTVSQVNPNSTFRWVINKCIKEIKEIRNENIK